MRTFLVYILANRHRRLYIGVTADLARRLQEHRRGLGSPFVRRYQMNRLVFVEQTTDALGAIRREKQLKGWTRARKLALIAAVNPGWEDHSGHVLGCCGSR